MDTSVVPRPKFSPAERRAVARKLANWFRRTARDLPWRRTNDLYAIWISEVMLQQTQVATVIPYYERFLASFPDVAALAAAEEQHVLRHWEGLGYYRRARQLHAAAQQVASEHGGRFPTQYAAVRALPGIGRYTAGAILSIGTGARLPILEANTIRVLSRLSAFRSDPLAAAGQKHLWSLAEQLLPARDVGTFNQALMELGSEVCTPKQPACDRCPISVYCRAFAANAQHEIPQPPRKTKYEDVSAVAAVVRRGERVLLRQCLPGERWAGLWDFPRVNAADLPSAEQRLKELIGLPLTLGSRLATIKHGVTRYRITLAVHEAAGRGSAKLVAGNSVQWFPISELVELPLSTTARKIATLLLTERNVARRSSAENVARRSSAE